MCKPDYDAVIVGAGPAGSSAAIRLSMAGRKVLLIDKDKFPRHKLCGEFVSPECIDHLNELGVTPKVENVGPATIRKTVFYSSGGRSFTVANKWLAQNDRESIGISRRSLDALLVDRAAKCGADISMETSADAVIEDERTAVLLKPSKQEISTRLLIDATGRGRYVARKFDRQTKTAKPAQVAFKAHLRGAKLDRDACEIFSYRGGYGGCAKIEDDLYNLCFIVDASLVREIGSDMSAILQATVFKNARAANVLSDINVEGDWLSVPIARYGSMDPAPAPGVIAVGDATAFIDPFTGSGIAMALESSRLACQAIVNSEDLTAIASVYRHSHAAVFTRRLNFCRVLRLLSNSPRLADAAIATLKSSEFLGKTFTRLTRSSPLAD